MKFIYLIKYQIVYFSLAILSVSNSQKINCSDRSSVNPSWFVSAHYGFQMSGIKDEDFVISNFTPLFNITVGKWFSPYLALQIGYKGFYFNYIGDDIKHHYNYFYGEAVLNLNNAVQPERINMGIHPFGKSWSLLLHAGAGYFYNHIYGKSNLCVNIGLQNNYQITNQFQATLDISSIIGWDIYQGNEDILPGITVGLIYLFNSN